MKPLSKQELIQEAKRYRDAMKGFVNESLMVSDEQIEKNVNKKYNVYLASVDFTNKTYTNQFKFNEFAKAKNQKNYAAFRNVECQSLDESQFEERLKEVNTPEKGKHFRAKTIERITKGNYKELSDVMLNPEKYLSI